MTADLCALIAPLSFAYATAFAGLLFAFALRAWLRRGGRVLSAGEAAWCAWMPTLAVITSSFAYLLHPYGIDLPLPLHAVWHLWADALTLSSGFHIALHVGNVLVLLTAAFGIARTVYGFAQICALTRALETSPVETALYGEIPFYRLTTSHALCFTLGVLRPRVYVSTSLIERLSRTECEAMLAHEVAHIARHDGLTKIWLLAFYRLFPLPGGGLLCREWERAAERACDADAARRIGDPCAVASALVEVTRLTSSLAVPGAAFFGADDIEARVHALLAMPPAGAKKENRPSALFVSLIALNLTLLFAIESWIRHLVELFVNH